jgi:PAS domain S-box-containing protein
MQKRKTPDGDDGARGVLSVPDLQIYVDEILEHLARFSWDTQYPVPFDSSRPDHPFQPVFEAMDLLNCELRELLLGRRKAEAAVLDSEARYRLIAEQTSEFISMSTFDQNPRYTYVSPSHRRVGYAPEELLGKQPLDFIHPEDRERLVLMLMDYLVRVQSGKVDASQLSETIEFRFREKSGGWIHVESTANLIKDQILLVSRDITERKRAQAFLEATHAQLEATLNALPAVADQPVPVSMPSSLPEIHGTGTILLVDDEEIIREVAGRMLEYLGFTVITASSGREAIQIYLRREDEIDLILLDIIMPEMMGLQTFDELKAINPEVRVLLTSGYSSEGQAADILRRGCRGFIQKPFQVEVLSRKIQEVLS